MDDDKNKDEDEDDEDDEKADFDPALVEELGDDAVDDPDLKVEKDEDDDEEDDDDEKEGWGIETE